MELNNFKLQQDFSEPLIAKYTWIISKRTFRCHAVFPNFTWLGNFLNTILKDTISLQKIFWKVYIKLPTDLYKYFS